MSVVIVIVIVVSCPSTHWLAAMLVPGPGTGPQQTRRSLYCLMLSGALQRQQPDGKVCVKPSSALTHVALHAAQLSALWMRQSEVYRHPVLAPLWNDLALAKVAK